MPIETCLKNDHCVVSDDKGEHCKLSCSVYVPSMQFSSLAGLSTSEKSIICQFVNTILYKLREVKPKPTIWHLSDYNEN